MHRSRIFLTCLLLFLLSACGSGGGGGSSGGNGNNGANPGDAKLVWDQGNWDKKEWQ